MDEEVSEIMEASSKPASSASANRLESTSEDILIDF